MTDVREGSGYAPVAGPLSVTYPRGALTGNREGSGYEPVRIGPRVSLGSTSYADGTLTEIREG